MTASRLDELCEAAWLQVEAGHAEKAGRLFHEICQLDPGNAEARMMMGVVYAEIGNSDQALECLQRAIEIDPDYPDPYLHLARLQLAASQVEAALENVRRATETDPEYADAWVFLGELCARSGDVVRTEHAYRKFLNLEPGRADIRNRLGAVLSAQGHFEEAVQECREALRIEPANSEIHANLGNVYSAQGKLADAADCFEKALELSPDFMGARLNLGNTLREMGKYPMASECYRQLLARNPGFSDGHISLGECYLKMGEFPQALECYDAALAVAPESPAAQLNRGFVLGLLQRYAEALESFRQVLASDAGHADAWFNRGLVEKKLGRYEEAFSSLQQALVLSPGNQDIQLSLSLLELLCGNFKEGWRNYGARKSVRDRAPVDPASLSGDLGGRRILLVKDQGLGDEIFFLRFARQLKERGAWLACQTDPKIKTLIERIPFLDAVLTESDTRPDVELSLSVGDLPYTLGLADRQVFPPPVSVSVLPQVRDKVQSMLSQAGTGPFIGVTWWAGTRQAMDQLGDRLAHREVPLRSLARVLRRIDAKVLILQRNPEADEISELSHLLGRDVIDMSSLNDDLEAMLALLAIIDDYIGVDNTNMHLSASIGKPCRILVPHPPEWRMMVAGKESEWFPGFTLYRQDVDGGWDGAMNQLELDLKAGLQQ